MERVNRILTHPLYRSCMTKIAAHEKERIFCGHDMGHLLDVARLAWIFNLEQGLHLERERVYAAALLHDIGRHIQYETGTPHQQAGVPIAASILSDCAFSEEEAAEILEAIANHRNADVRERPDLSGVLYRADKMSRSCFGCPAQRACRWSQEKKNLDICY